MSSSPPRPGSAASSITATDVEAQPTGNNKISQMELLLDHAGVNDLVLNAAYPGQGTKESPYVVDFLPADAHNPMNFTNGRKWQITMMQALASLAVTFVSTAYSGAIREVIIDFRVSTEIAILGVSLFVLGFAIGPLLWAPLSELYGRQLIFFITYFGLTVFNAGAIASQNIETLIVLRFFAGAFGSSPLTNAGGVIADMFSAAERGPAAAAFALAPFLGPTIGPIVGGFLGEAGGWRWVEALMALFTGAIWIAATFLIPETYAPYLLRRRADKLSTITGKVYISKYEVHTPRKTVLGEFKVALSRPWILLFTEPIVLLLSIYTAIVYGTLYLLFAAFPIVFQQGRGWSPGIGGLAFIGVAVGNVLALVYNIWYQPRYLAIAKKHGGMAPPEARLQPAIVGSILLPVGLFWFAWTNGPEIHWIVPIIAASVFSIGLVLVFLSLLTYLIDSYVIFAASVLAANTVLRSLFGAAFPLFTTYMYENLGIHWASSVPAFLALACVPFPFLFYKYGKDIRMKSTFAAEAANVLERMRSTHEVVNPDEAIEEAIERAKTRELEKEGRLEKEDGPSGSSDDETISGRQ